jgi:hypothetical protein
MTAVKYIREGIFNFFYYLINCAIAIINLIAMVYFFFQSKKTDYKAGDVREGKLSSL